MTLEYLYMEMKLAMNFLEVSWGNMNEVSVHVQNNRLFFTHGGKQVSTVIPEKEHVQEKRMDQTTNDRLA